MGSRLCYKQRPFGFRGAWSVQDIHIRRIMSSQSTRPKVLLSGALASLPCPNPR